jgi:cytochrome c oxidase subunit 4
MSERTTFVLVYLACLVLLAATMTVAQFQLGALNPILNMAISVVKASLVIWFFMHVRRAGALLRLAVVAGLFWLMIMFGLTLSDYLSRGPAMSLPEPGADTRP